MKTLTSVCRPQVRRAIWCFWVPVSFEVERDGTKFVREFEDIFIHLN